MTRAEAIAILSGRMVGAVTYADYVAWLERQTTDVLVALADGRRAHRFAEEDAA